MSGLFLVKYGEQTDLRFPMVKAGVADLAASADWTPATGDTKLMKDGGAIANTTNNPSVVASSVNWKLTLTGIEMQMAEGEVQIVDSATKAVEDQFLKVITYGHPSAKLKNDLAAVQPAWPVSRSTIGFTTQATNHNVTLPSYVQANDLLLIIFCCVGNPTITTPAGWTLLNGSANGTSLTVAVYAKKANGTEGGTSINFVTSTGQRAAAQYFIVRAGTWFGDDSSSFVNSVRVANSTGSSTSPLPYALTAPWIGLNEVYLVYEGNADGTITDTAYPANYVDRTNVVSNAASTGVSLTTCNRSSKAIPETPGAFTITSANWIAGTIVIRPAVPAAYVENVNLVDEVTSVTGTANVNVTQISFSSTAADQLAGMFAAAVKITVDDTTFTPTTTVFETDQTTDDAVRYEEQVLFGLTGANAGKTVAITAYNYSANSKVKLTVEALSTAPSNGDTFLMMGRIEQ